MPALRAVLAWEIFQNCRSGIRAMRIAGSSLRDGSADPIPYMYVRRIGNVPGNFVLSLSHRFPTPKMQKLLTVAALAFAAALHAQNPPVAPTQAPTATPTVPARWDVSAKR